jgi:selenocysteine lyase/cysteine desulfurase
VHASYYGPPLRLATDARRFDVSPAWFSWVGTAPALELLEQIGIQAVHDHDVALADRFRAGLGLEPGASPIVTASIEGARERFARAGIRAATRAGALRVSFHLYSTEAEVDTALDALAG